MKPPARICTEGASTPVWSYGETLALAGSHPRTITQTSFRSGLDTAMPSLRPLASSRTRKLRRLDKYPVVQPLRVIETPVDKVDAHVVPPSDNPDRFRVLQKSLAQIKVVYIYLSHRLSFQLSRNPRVYTVGTTAEF
jgi:hypothetical protein